MCLKKKKKQLQACFSIRHVPLVQSLPYNKIQALGRVLPDRKSMHELVPVFTDLFITFEKVFLITTQMQLVSYVIFNL